MNLCGAPRVAVRDYQQHFQTDESSRDSRIGGHLESNEPDGQGEGIEGCQVGVVVWSELL